MQHIYMRKKTCYYSTHRITDVGIPFEKVAILVLGYCDHFKVLKQKHMMVNKNKIKMQHVFLVMNSNVAVKQTF